MAIACWPAVGGAEAVSLYTENADEIQAVIVDMMMPGMDGPATIRALRDIRPDVRVITSSGFPRLGPRPSCRGRRDIPSETVHRRTVARLAAPIVGWSRIAGGGPRCRRIRSSVVSTLGF